MWVDAASLWTDLVAVQTAWRARRSLSWEGRARQYRAEVEQRWARPDSTRELVSTWVGPGTTLLDIGAGTGAWAALFAERGARVTALEPSRDMREVMDELLAERGVVGVEVVDGTWPEAEVVPHDIAFCSHAVYGCSDLVAFVRAMEAVAPRCALLLRAPLVDGVMARAARLVWGHPFDSACFQVAYLALLQLGILAHVHVESGEPWGGWSHDSLDQALDEVRGRLGLSGATPYDEALRDLLERSLERREGRVYWPPSVRSALVWWDR